MQNRLFLLLRYIDKVLQNLILIFYIYIYNNARGKIINVQSRDKSINRETWFQTLDNKPGIDNDNKQS